MSSTTSWRSFAEKLRRLPHAFDSRHSFAGEVVGSHEQRIVVEGLRSGWFVVGVVHPDQYVPRERPASRPPVFLPPSASELRPPPESCPEILTAAHRESNECG